MIKVLLLVSVVNLLVTVLLFREYRKVRHLLETWIRYDDAPASPDFKPGELAARGTMAMQTLEDLRARRRGP